MENNFILSGSIDKKLCDEIVNWFKFTLDHNNKFNGKWNVHGKDTIDLSKKNSLDSSLRYNKELESKFIDSIHFCAKEYIQKFKFCNEYSPWDIVEDINVQYYRPNSGGFHSWHTERHSNTPPVSHRHLVFMTYLNDVEEGGETEFYHQNVKFKPKKGLSLIWPADWTYTHRGLQSKYEKYIVTGWFSYM